MLLHMLGKTPLNVPVLIFFIVLTEVWRGEGYHWHVFFYFSRIGEI